MDFQSELRERLAHSTRPEEDDIEPGERSRSTTSSETQPQADAGTRQAKAIDAAGSKDPLAWTGSDDDLLELLGHKVWFTAEPLDHQASTDG